MGSERFLVTGAMGCLGAWVVRQLVDDGAAVVAFDLGEDDRRLRLVAGAERLAHVSRVTGDLTDGDHVRAAAAGATHVIHLGALQIPFCKADPARGSAVNVTGTVNVFEAARAHGIAHLAFASSIAVYGPPEEYATAILGPDAERRPATLYGAFKVANEDTAKVYWRDHGLPSVGLRPHSVYGPGRDRGLTSQPTAAIAAAVRGEPCHIDFGGTLDLQYAADVAGLFIAAARAEPGGGETYSLQGTVTSVVDFLAALGEVTGADGITHGDAPLPVPAGADDGPLQVRLGPRHPTPLRDGIAATADVLGRDQH